MAVLNVHSRKRHAIIGIPERAKGRKICPQGQEPGRPGRGQAPPVPCAKRRIDPYREGGGACPRPGHSLPYTTHKRGRRWRKKSWSWTMTQPLLICCARRWLMKATRHL